MTTLREYVKGAESALIPGVSQNAVRAWGRDRETAGASKPGERVSFMQASGIGIVPCKERETATTKTESIEIVSALP